jgi:hypothetical protein
MSAAPPPPDTSVVDTCTKKIMAALETEDVKVIGRWFIAVYRFV